MKIQIIKKFESLFTKKLTKYRVICYYGGRGGGKTESISDFAILECLQNSNINFYCAREIKNSNDNSLINLFQTKIKNYKLQKFVSSKSSKQIAFKNGSKIIFVGVSKITIDNIRSIYNANYFWFEECHKIDSEILEVLIPSIRARSTENRNLRINSQIILTFNPQKKDDFIYKNFVEKQDDSYFKSFEVNYSDNVFFPKEMELDRINDFKTKPFHIYEHIWEGKPRFLEGNIIDISKIGFFDDTIAVKYKEIFVSMDTAYQTTNYSDYSVIGIFGIHNDNLNILRILRARMEFAELIQNVNYANNYCKEFFSQSPKVFLIEEKSSGISLIQELKRSTNFNIKAIKPTKDKYTRLCEVLHLFPKLNFPLSKNELNFWVEDVRQELIEFRADMKHKHDDIVDVIVYALSYFKQKNSIIKFSEINRRLGI